MEQTQFLTDTFFSESKESKIVTSQQIVDNIETHIFAQFQNYQKFEEVKNMQEIFKQFLDKQFINLNIHRLFEVYPVVEQIKKQIINALQITKQLYLRAHTLAQLPQQIQKKIDENIRNVLLYFIFIIKPDIKPVKPQQQKELLKKITEMYNAIKQKQTKFKLAYKLATILEHKKEYKKVIGVYLHLEKHQNVMNILNLIAQTPKQPAVQWYSLFAEEYLKKKRFTYFQKCIEMAKKYAGFNIQQVIRLQERLSFGASQLSKVPELNGSLLKKDSSLENRLLYWSWEKIDEQILFIRMMLGFEPTKNKNIKEVIARNLRS